MSVKLVWITPNADQMVGYMARVSNPDAQPDDPAEKLIAFLLRNRHWSPFEMANVCVEVNTTRDIARQLLRHRSFSFQEFSQRYAVVPALSNNKEVRLQDTKNRQNSIKTDDEALKTWWELAQNEVKACVKRVYEDAIQMGVAKEVARVVLPEGLTPTKMYVNGNMRSWLTYFSARIGQGTQLEHEEVARDAWKVFEQHAPDVAAAYLLHAASSRS